MMGEPLHDGLVSAGEDPKAVAATTRLASWTTKDLLSGDLLADDDEDDDYVEGSSAADDDEADEHDVEEDDDDDEAATDDDDEEECDGHVSDLFRSAASILTKRVLRDGTMADTQKRPGLTIYDIGLDEDDVEDVDYMEKGGELGKDGKAEEQDEDEDDDDEDDDDENDEEHDTSDSDDAMDEVDEDEVADIVVNAATVSLPSKDAIRLRGGKEIVPSEHELDLAARLQQVPSMPGGTSDAAASQTPSKADEARAYLAKHRIEQVLQQLMAALLHQRPDDPRALMIKKLEEMRAAKARNQSLPAFTKENLAAVFRVFDVVGRGYITPEQYRAAMADVGVEKFDPNPPGTEARRISAETFVDRA
ncbi:EF-hand calcium-binding domain-containing protein 10, partial [Cladochytrium tenue]